MARTESGRRFFAVKVWNEWLPPVNGFPHAELCLLLVLAENAEEASTLAWSRTIEVAELCAEDGWQTYCHDQPVDVFGLGVDQVFDTGRSDLTDFDDDPLVFTYLFPVHGDREIDYFNRSRLVQPEVIRRGDTPYFGLPKMGQFREGSMERWFGVKVWRTWSIADEARFFEEVVLAVRATSGEEASEKAIGLALEADCNTVNDKGEEFLVRVVNVDCVFEGHSQQLVYQTDQEVFGQLYTMNPDDTVEFYDSDNDLPFREYSLGD